MKKLVFKEFKLVISGFVYLFLLCSAMFLIPSYPSWVSMIYAIVAIIMSFSMIRYNKDIEFTATLPISRNDIVLSKCFTISAIQLVFLVVSIPFAVLSSLVINKGGNITSIDANIAFYGIILICFAVFNITFIPQFFKTAGTKFGFAIATALAAFFASLIFFELIVALVPALNTFIDTLDVKYIGYHFIVLAVGIAVYIGLLILSYKLSVKNFERVSI